MNLNKIVEQQFYSSPFEHIYHVFPLGALRKSNEIDPHQKNPDEYNNIKSLLNLIPHLKDISADAILLGPVFESATHGYDTIDYRKVDSRLGNWQDLKDTIEEFKKNNIAVILDGVFNHTSRYHWAYQDLQNHGENSQFKEWYSGVRFYQANRSGDTHSTDCWDGFEELPKLNLQNPQVQSEILDIIKLWIEDLKIDGLRLDAADVMDRSFLRNLVQQCKNINSNFWLLGEVVHGDYRLWLDEANLDSVTNYEGYKSLWSSFNDHNFFEIAHSLDRMYSKEQGIYKTKKLSLFNENHDVNRLAFVLKERQHNYPLHLMYSCLPGVLSTYYGEEFELRASKGASDDWAIRPSLSELESASSDLSKNLQNLYSIRKKSNALKAGAYEKLLVQSEQMAFARTWAINSYGQNSIECVIVAINMSDKKTTVKIKLPEIIKEKIRNGERVNLSFWDLIGNKEVKTPFLSNKSEIELKLEANWGSVLSVNF